MENNKFTEKSATQKFRNALIGYCLYGQRTDVISILLYLKPRQGNMPFAMPPKKTTESSGYKKLYI